MRSLFLSAAIAAIAAPAWGQAHILHSEEINSSCSTIGGGGEFLAIGCPYFKADEIISIGQAIGGLQTEQLTSPASILTQAEIRARNQGVVADLLRTIPGLSVSQSGGAGALTQIRLRGSEANHVTVIIDGVEAANPSDGAFDFGGLRTEDIVKIEVLRGEQSALFGSDAIGGVINIITRAGSTSESWRASFEGGSRDTYEGQVSAVMPLGDAALSLNGNLFNTEGFDISGLGGEQDGTESRALNIGLNTVELGPVILSGKYGHSTRDTEFDSDSDFDGRLNNTVDETEVQIETFRLDARFNLAGFDHKISGFQSETDTDTVGGFSTRSIGTRSGVNWAAKREFADQHSFTALIEAERETYRIIPNFTEADAEPDNTAYAVAGDYRFTSDNLTLTASGRYDINDLFQDSTTWRLGAGYGFSWDGRLRASVGTGVKNPTLIELFGFFPSTNFIGNPDLEPESSLGVSIGYEQSIGDFNFSIDAFRSELSDEITTLFNPDFSTTVVNLDTDSSRQGIELAADWSTDAFQLSGSASFLDSEQDDIEEIRRPNFLASVTGTWTPTGSLALTVSVDHNGEQLDTDFATFQNVELDSFTLLGANARYKLNDHVALTFRGSNLLDEDYQEVVGFASAGRGVFGGLEVGF